MARQREFDEEKALTAAMELFWEKGFEAASLSELTSRMGIQKPSLYAAYGDKKGLFEAALRKYTSAHAAQIRSSLQSVPSVKKAFRVLFGELVVQGRGESANWGCFCINSMVEMAPHDEKFEILTREHQMYLSVIFEETIERGQRTGELEPQLDAKRLAQTLVVSLIGLTVILKSRPERAFVDRSVEGILAMLF
ncbi:TetR/AcrR family transcriptional regulator [Paenibacillus spiritus]|uniref:TetR/AcrR family transcriptional regulator n=1 Tax=Paenibacillus spiritus TaxID=2496557 RepID=A0A5J5FYK0_9BACL|nr:TetR/AcrR family transcriptional regulator [Paenibacillus spiritus]KAA8998828.1 TetR/AcrR family transcriptional regulator [Paenibacillus spiritus]